MTYSPPAFSRCQKTRRGAVSDAQVRATSGGSADALQFAHDFVASRAPQCSNFRGRVASFAVNFRNPRTRGYDDPRAASAPRWRSSQSATLPPDEQHMWTHARRAQSGAAFPRKLPPPGRSRW